MVALNGRSVLVGAVVAASLGAFGSAADAAPTLSQYRAYRTTLASAQAASRLWNSHHANNPILDTITTCAAGRVSATKFICLSEAMTQENVGLDEQWSVILRDGVVHAKPLGNPFIAGTQ